MLKDAKAKRLSIIEASMPIKLPAGFEEFSPAVKAPLTILINNKLISDNKDAEERDNKVNDKAN